MASRAASDLKRLGFEKLHARAGDGYRGWPEAAPFDAILVTAAPPEVPRALLEQLAMGGHLVIPVDEGWSRVRIVGPGHSPHGWGRWVSLAGLVVLTLALVRRRRLHS